MTWGWRLRRALALLAGLASGCHPDKIGPGTGWIEVTSGVAYHLESGEAYHREAPETFEIPPRQDRERLRPGQIVKLIFNIADVGRSGDDTQVERMWVIVQASDRGGYVGVLDNQPYSTDQIRPGLHIRFGPEHVIQIHERRASVPTDP